MARAEFVRVPIVANQGRGYALLPGTTLPPVWREDHVTALAALRVLVEANWLRTLRELAHAAEAERMQRSAGR